MERVLFTVATFPSPIRGLRCHFYEDIKDYQLMLKTMVRQHSLCRHHYLHGAITFFTSTPLMYLLPFHITSVIQYLQHYLVDIIFTYYFSNSYLPYCFIDINSVIYIFNIVWSILPSHMTSVIYIFDITLSILPYKSLWKCISSISLRRYLFDDLYLQYYFDDISSITHIFETISLMLPSHSNLVGIYKFNITSSILPYILLP